MKHHKTRPTAEQLSPIIKSVYDAALDLNQWSNVIDSLTTLFDAHGGVLRYINHDRHGKHFGVQFGYDNTYIEQYNNHYYQVDKFNTKLKGFEGYCMRLSRENFHKWFDKNDPFYNEFLVKYDVYNMMGANIIENEQGHFVLGMHRSPGAGAFSEDDKSTYELLAPHLKKAVEIQNLLHEHQQQCQAGYDAIDCLPFGIIFLDQHRKPVWHNRRAAEIVANRQSLNITSDKVHCHQPDESRTLSRLIDNALRQGRYQGGQMVLKGNTGNLTLFVVPLGLHNHQYSAVVDQARVVIFIGDTSFDRNAPADVLQMLYALTPAEARLVNGLCEGLTIKEMEQLFDLKASTLRSQLKSVFHKTGTNRQAELVALVMSGPAMLKVQA